MAERKKYSALAADYDGTLATGGTVEPECLEALQRLKTSGRRLILVTGRQIGDLLSVCPFIPLFDRVVAENGGVLYRPDTGDERPLCPPPSPDFLALLTRRGIDHSVGRVIVATREPNQFPILAAVQDLGLELQVIFNKGAVMVLPSGVDKATGLRAALAELAILPENTVGVGDAENDHVFLARCGFSVAVANALPFLKKSVDFVTSGERGAGIVELIGHLLGSDLQDLPSPGLTGLDENQ
jgi:hydroxymethylpyrimidine pyrophosphatase-like HAD family hydrolase